MIGLKEKTLQSFLYKAKEQATALQTKQLISWTKQINEVDMLDVFESAKQTGKDRLFWTNSTNDFSFVGVGSVKKIVAGKNRFAELQTAWQEVLQDAMINDAYKKTGTGLMTIGGMTFDPERKRSPLWEKYPPSQLTIPECTVVQNEHTFYFTMNHYVSENDDIAELITYFQTVESALFSGHRVEMPPQKVFFKKEIAPDKWKTSVQKAVNEIKQQRAKKIVLAREMRITLNQDAHIASMLRKLRRTQANSYIFAFEHGDNCFLGATPERLVRVEGEKLLSTCLAGTAPRGETKEQDEQIANDLLHDEKNREEHDYVVQMIKQSIAPYCGEIAIPKEPVIYPLRNLQHLYTPVTAKLRPNFTVFDIIEKLHPTPALGGVPREKALCFMREEECLDRGWYGAPIGWLDSNQNSEFAVAIRSGLVQKNEVSLFAGCGVMRDSDPNMEYEETNVKFLPMLTIMEDHDESY